MEGKHNFLRSFVGSSSGFNVQLSQQRISRSSVSSMSSVSSSGSSSLDNSPLSDQPPSPPGGGVISDKEASVSSAMDCQQCLRQGAPLFCFSCGFWMANGRVRQPCSRHPKVIFYTDFSTCPKCKRPGQLRELD